MDSIRIIIFNTFQNINLSVELSNLFSSLIIVVLWIFIGVALIYIVKNVLFKVFKIKERGARALTIGKLTSSISKYVIWFMIFMMILSELNIDLTPFIASAGVIGLAIGFGAQEVVKDFLSGFFIIFEESFNVGDVIEVNGFKGNVIGLGLRTTSIINWRGEVNIIQNGDIRNIINFSKENSVAVIDFGVSYNTDLKKFPKHMDKFIEGIDGKYDKIIEKPKYLGITKLDDSSINMRVIAKTVASEHFQIERDLRTDLVIFCVEHNIEIPFPQIVVHNE